jgi:hypothetical protein
LPPSVVANVGRRSPTTAASTVVANDGPRSPTTFGVDDGQEERDVRRTSTVLNVLRASYSV